MSINIDNFSLGVGAYSSATGSVSVDITDSFHNITTSGCYFELDGTTVSSTLTSISGGYTMTYDPDDDFASFSGPTELRAYGSNDNGDTASSAIYLTSGYVVEYVNSKQDGWDLGYNSSVVVRAGAENMASCPIKSAEAFWFETESRPNKHLGARIVGVPTSEYADVKNLSATIYPQSTAFFYGSVYKVVLRAKDFAGNEMEPFEFEFKIEDEP